MRMRIDTLDKVIPEGDLNTFYTNVNPESRYIGAAVVIQRSTPAAVPSCNSGKSGHGAAESAGCWLAWRGASDGVTGDAQPVVVDSGCCTQGA